MLPVELGRKVSAFLLAIAAMFFLLAGQGFAGSPKTLKGVALVIGQSKYEHLSPLANPARDAQAISALFTGLGFNVTTTTDRNAKKLARDLANFAADAEGADVAVVYYSGHGIEAGGENWLVPVDADVSSLDDAAKNLVPLSSVMDGLKATVPVTLLFLDACRTNPFPPGATLKRDGAALPMAASGLGLSKGVIALSPATAESGLGTVIGFAAEPGTAALDGPADGNSPYAAALLRHLAATTGDEFGTVMRMVTEEVYLKTGGQQRPWVNETLTRLLYFGGEPEDATSDEGRLNAGRRALLLTIDGLDAGLRKTVEQLAKENGLPLDPLYGMLKQLQVDTAAGPEEIDKQLRAGVEAVKKLKEQRDTITRTDPEIIKYTGLANRAEAEGAIPLAQDYRAKASGRASEVSKSLKAEEADIKARHLEVAATFAKEAETAILAFDHKKAAEKYGLAFAEVEGQDANLALNYKWREADARRKYGDYKGDNESLEQAIAAYDAAIKLALRGFDRDTWAALQNELGSALRNLGERESGTARLDEAVAAYRATLQEWTRERVPLDWAMAQNNLGNALVALGEREIGTARLEEAVAAYRAALAESTREKAPLDWARTQNNLGGALVRLGERESGTARLHEAVEAFRAALEVRTREKVPRDWATAQDNLGNALTKLGESESGTARLEEAVTAYRAALEERTREKVPLRWAQTQNNLGNALRVLGERESGTARLDEAVAAFHSALQEWTRKRVPLDWATTQYNLGLALEDLGERESGTARLEEAVQAYRAALEEWPREMAPLYWAWAQNNLGWVLKVLGERRRNPELIREGRSAMQEAWDELKASGQDHDSQIAEHIAACDAALKALQ